MPPEAEATTTPTEPVTPEPVTPTPEPAPKPEPDKPLGEAGEKALEAMKTRAREAEKAAKAATAELEELRKAAMSDQEKAVAEAEARGRQTATSEVAGKIVDAEIRAALTGVVPDPAAVVEDLNLAKYITAEGDVDRDAIAKLAEKYASFSNGKTTPAVPGGPRDHEATATVDQQIAAAMKAGDTRTVIALNSAKLAELVNKNT